MHSPDSVSACRVHRTSRPQLCSATSCVADSAPGHASARRGRFRDCRVCRIAAHAQASRGDARDRQSIPSHRARQKNRRSEASSQNRSLHGKTVRSTSVHELMTDNHRQPVCDYEGSSYRRDFWGQGRAYEDAAERVALRRLLPPTGSRLVDVGAGYGRLVPLYSGYDEVILFDYALSQLREAQELWGSHGPNGSPSYVYVAGDFYSMPFALGAFQTVVMVRTLHHAADAASVIRGISNILQPGGRLVLEFANKRNLKAVLRYLLRRQDWSPFDPAPVEFVPLNFDFHPAWIAGLLADAGLRVEERRAVSSFRLESVKRLVPTSVLVALERICQPLGSPMALSPSVFVRCERGNPTSCPKPTTLFRCPVCGCALEEEGDKLPCVRCGSYYRIQDGIYNFKEPCGDIARPSAGHQTGSLSSA